ncbi:ATP-grasp domain-containing protein [Pseudomonas putida]|uniref:ATP-grasp domain-containing protein n=1 Tax=Pseudomonas putida TaxID=303 RepID=A0A8I1EGL9_PSEPU|nr:ATP-grasp domain-containing protein [Pseudomonas putida]MBI6885146.1 ATP-grasp domain-containing protein [Pseudomonas putida]
MSVLIEHKSGFCLNPEEALVAGYLKASGQAFEIASLSQVDRARVDATSKHLVVGTIPFIAAALRQRGITLVAEDTYPSVLSGLMRRRVWKSTIKRAQESIEDGSRPFFIKPYARAKRFTGFVLTDSMDYRLVGVSRNESIWCSEVISFVSEWRMYVIRGRLVHSGHYGGSHEVKPSGEVVDEAIRLMSSQAGCPASYALDMGVTDTGETALVEVNDAYAIGAYGIEPGLYFSFLKTRWDELCA